LSLSSERALSTTRNLVLRSAGHFVHVVATAAEALASLEAERFDVALIGHSIGPEQQRALTREIKRRWPELPVIAIPSLDAGRIAEADRSLEALSDPRVLLGYIEELVLSGKNPRT
jgi:DNA-binding NtrC family response regulator